MKEVFIVVIAIVIMGLILKIMKKALKLVFIIAIIGLVGFLIYNFKFKMPKEALETETLAEEQVSPGIEAAKKVAMIVAFRDFRDDEYFVPKEVLEGAGIEITTVSDQEGTAIGADGGEVEVDILLGNFQVQDFDAIVFIGGPGALGHLDNEESYRIAKETVAEGKVLAAICISPTILAKAKVLEGKRATVWSSPLDRGPIKTLEENGAVYEDKPVVVEGKIVTGNGPSAARGFGEAIVRVLQTD